MKAIIFGILAIFHFGISSKGVDAIICKYYPYIASNDYSFYTTECSDICCSGFQTTSASSCCASESTTASTASAPAFQWYYVVVPIVGVTVLVVIISFVVYICKKKQRDRELLEERRKSMAKVANSEKSLAKKGDRYHNPHNAPFFEAAKFKDFTINNDLATVSNVNEIFMPVLPSAVNVENIKRFV